MKTPFEILVEHCHETHPHMESPRGKIDLHKAEQEYAALVAVAEAADRLQNSSNAELASILRDDRDLRKALAQLTAVRKEERKMGSEQ